MTDLNFTQATAYKEQIAFLTALKLELEGTDQKVVNLTARPHLPSLDDTLEAVEDFLTSQALTAVNDQITTIQALYHAL